MTKTKKVNIQILYEDNHLIVINKACGVLVQADKTKDVPLSEMVKDYIKSKYNKPGAVFLGVIHRLDRPTSGAVVFAKTSKALTRMTKLFKERHIAKTYWAVVKHAEHLENNPTDRLTHFLVRNPKNNTSKAYNKEMPNSKKAILDYRVIQKLNNYLLLEINLLTGRHHQIRTQLSKINCPIKGDLKYGFSRSNLNGGIHLHARTVSFVHPIKKEQIKITAPLPTEDNIWSFIDQN